MSTQYTPGPWLYAWTGGSVLVFPKGGATIAGVPYESDNEIHQAEANARLIAASPDLLEALRLVADLSSTQWQESDGSMRAATDNRGRMMHFINIDVMKEVDKAIAKAQGEKI